MRCIVLVLCLVILAVLPASAEAEFCPGLAPYPRALGL